MQKGKFYVAKVNDWDGTLELAMRQSFDTEEEAKAYADETYWPSDEVVVFECKTIRERP